ncbi:globin family protein [Limnofasciculus baicalensis]|uniref:Globin domain-containing protein n=1 Tax=Limnofasciculus baicalensis BBK-W-15 TaxID=2699891 RepID=A0AAE3GUQ6_9CYAN|nr:globin family protein [Limnofasciculus baicalensis]MCP2730422.1 globin domain-containing protein [Limnofasciculus baicalensis BBK-W-15]
MLNVEILETSFQAVQDSNQNFPTAFYSNLLGDYPEVKPLFANTRMDEQGNHLFESLKFVVANLRNSELLAEKLKGLGTRHVKYGVLPQHYPLVGNSLLKTLATIAGDAWTSEVKQAWVDAYTAITSIMLEGADYPPEVLKLTEE